MRSYKLIYQLIQLVEKLEEKNKDAALSLQDFAGYLITRLQDTAHPGANTDVRFGKNEPYAQDLAFQLDNNIARLFIYISRYAKGYIKKALEGSRLQSAEEFTALAILLTHDDLSKSELIGHNLQEKTSGTEVIRRLLSAGLVHQWAGDKDKRSKRIAITQDGKDLLYDIFGGMAHVGKIVTGNLTIAEKLTLQFLLNKLEDFHYPIFNKRAVATRADLETMAGSLN